MQSFYQKSNVCKNTHDRLFEAFGFVDLRIVKELLQNEVYNTLTYLRACSSQLFLYLFRICYIDDVVEDIVIDIFLDDLSCCSYCHFILLDFFIFFSESSRGFAWTYINEVPYIFLYRHYFCKVGPSRPSSKAFELFSTRFICIVAMFFGHIAV